MFSSLAKTAEEVYAVGEKPMPYDPQIDGPAQRPTRTRSLEGAVPQIGHEFSTGARRSEIMPRYDLIPTAGLRRLAIRYAEGAEKYGEYNWQKGLPVDDTLNHVIEHLLNFRDHVNSTLLLGNPPAPREDDLAAAAWGLFTLMHFEQFGPFALKSQMEINPKK